MTMMVAVVSMVVMVVMVVVTMTMTMRSPGQDVGESGARSLFQAVGVCDEDIAHLDVNVFRVVGVCDLRVSAHVEDETRKEDVFGVLFVGAMLLVYLATIVVGLGNYFCKVLFDRSVVGITDCRDEITRADIFIDVEVLHGVRALESGRLAHTRHTRHTRHSGTPEWHTRELHTR